MGGERKIGWLRPRTLRHLTLLQAASLLSGLGLATAFLLGALQSVWSFAVTIHARSRGPAEACSDLLSDARSHEITIVSRAPSGYACEANLASGGFVVQEHFAGTSVLFILAIAAAVASILVFVGLVGAAIAKAVVTKLLDGRTGRASSWAMGLLIAACFLTPCTFLAQYAQWYSASNSGGSSVFPSGFPFFAFLGCLALAVLAVGMIIVARLSPKERDRRPAVCPRPITRTTH